jgi:oligoendopeptidase F
MSGKLPERKEIEEKYKWKLEDIYENDEAFEKDYKKASDLCGIMSNYKDRISSDPKVLKECLDKYEEMACLGDNLYSYSRMRMDEDNSSSKYQVLTGRTHELMVKADTSTSFIEPAIAGMSEEFLADPVLAKYGKFINDIVRKKKHTLSDKEERILAMSQEATGGPDDIFSMFNNADITFPEITDEKGNPVQLTKGRYTLFLENKDQRVRRDAYNALYDTYGKYKNTLAASYTSNIKVQKFYSDAKGYASSLEMALDQDNVSTDVYDSLINSINKNLHLLHRYVAVRAKALKMDKVNMYDLYVPLVEEDNEDYKYERACELVADGLSALGEEYVGLLKKGFTSGWVDVYESRGKTSGAYSWGTYLSHPYVLLNYQGNIDNVFTLAHEMGHSLHSYYSAKNQTYIYSRYKIFGAEVASTVNEILLLKDMLKKTDNPKKEAFLINHFLETFRGTVFRQTMFAEFEKTTHESFKKGVPLSGDDLCSMYLELNRKYFGEKCMVDDRIKYEWSRIPHFYSSFYVYKYATGFSAAAAIVRMIEEEGNPALERYLEFLKTGDFMYPLDVLKKTGVDLTEPATVDAGMAMFNELLTRFERLI